MWEHLHSLSEKQHGISIKCFYSVRSLRLVNILKDGRSCLTSIWLLGFEDGRKHCRLWWARVHIHNRYSLFNVKFTYRWSWPFGTLTLSVYCHLKFLSVAVLKCIFFYCYSEIKSASVLESKVPSGMCYVQKHIWML